MRLTFAHHGLQFFFLTICVEGRRAVLSRLVEGAKRPELTRAGECVKALWRAVHWLNPALTASDYVIMPDHVHLLLIVDYDRDPTFKPLVFLHWFMEESARMIATDGGRAPAPLPVACPFGAGYAPAPLPPLPTSMRRSYCPFPTGASASRGVGAQSALERQSPSRGAGALPPSVAAFWERRFWLDLSFSSRQLAVRRMLLLSALPVGAPFDRNTCHRMNDLVVAMCRRARGEILET